MADEELISAGIEVLENLAAMLMEDAHETAVSVGPKDHDKRLVRVRALRQTGADIATIADACEVLIRRAAETRPSEDDGASP